MNRGDPLAVALLAGAVAGAVAIAVTVAIERLGGRRGGLLATLPSTIVPASLGIWAQSPSEVFVAAMDATPVGMLVNALFLLSWRLLPPRLPAWPLAGRLTAMIAISLAVWAGLAAGMYTSTSWWTARGGDTLTLAVGATVALAAVGLLATRRALPSPPGTRAVALVALLARGLFAAAAIGAGVLIAAAGSGLLAGVVLVFPAIFLTAMVSVWIAQGEAVPMGAAGPMMLGATSVAAYALAARWALPAWGPWGAACGWILAVIATTWPAHLWLRSRSFGLPTNS